MNKHDKFAKQSSISFMINGVHINNILTIYFLFKLTQLIAPSLSSLCFVQRFMAQQTPPIIVGDLIPHSYLTTTMLAMLLPRSPFNPRRELHRSEFKRLARNSTRISSMVTFTRGRKIQGYHWCMLNQDYQSHIDYISINWFLLMIQFRNILQAFIEL